MIAREMVIPFFILAGQIMGYGGMSQKMIAMANVFIGRIRIEDMVRPMMPFYLFMFITLMAITYIPQISLWLPELIMK